ncbi:MAG: HAD family hydrolase [Proteobacteria bacterium]|nr:HAD family hydrolase [Pseudomonadota bacterium]
MPIKAIIFDLYGTLIDFKQKSFIKELSAYLGVSPKSVAEKLFKNYLHIAFENTSLMISTLLKALFNQEPKQEIVSGCISILEKYLREVKLKHGVLNTLSFFKAKGYQLGLVSNLASSFKQPVYQLGLYKFFDAIVFSCDCGLTKPNSEIYQLICQSLKIDAESCLFVGDSFPNDYQAPKNFGMQAFLVGEKASDNVRSIHSVNDLGWLNFDADFEKLIYLGKKIKFNDKDWHMTGIEALSDDESGRYNMVARVMLEENSQAKCTVYIKRFATPSSIQVEKLAYEIYGMVGLSTCQTGILEGKEPLLMTSEVAGEAWDIQYAEKVAYEIGQYTGMAYMFSNADFRPRNVLLKKSALGNKMQLIDFEHCFFNVALDLTGLNDVNNPLTFNAMCTEEISARRRHTVLSPKHIKRAVISFFGSLPSTEKILSAYKSGCLDTFSKVRAIQENIKDLFHKQILFDSSPMMIGTHAYRRAMANIDIEEMMVRINQDISETNLLWE